MNKILIIFIASLVSIIIFLPSIIVFPYTKEGKAIENNQIEVTTEQKKPQKDSEVETTVSVYRMQSKQIENKNIEDYVKGVVASEMPINFEIEALKAQAIVARTYIINMLMNPSDLNIPNGANITDSTLHQVYKNNNELKKQWGEDYNKNIKKITEAVEDTKGAILTYKDEPISPTFFSTSNGYTENSEDYWSTQLPYLRSVESPWDKEAPKSLVKTEFTVKDIERKLGVELNRGPAVKTHLLYAKTDIVK